MQHEDSQEFRELRRKLINTLRHKGIHNQRVLDAIDRVPRQFFMSGRYMEYAYADRAFAIDEGQTISQPYTVAFQTDLIDVQPGEKVLEIGTGSGYQCAVLHEMGAEVYTIERNKVLFKKASKLLKSLGYKPHCYLGDGYLGISEWSPYDKIIITAAAPEVPPALLSQLRVGGKLVVPVGEPGTQQMMLIEKISDDEFRETAHGNFVFVPLIKGNIED